MHAYFFGCMQILLQTTPDSLTSFILCFLLLLGNSAETCKDLNIYIYFFRSNSCGLALLGPARPDKFINLASPGIKYVPYLIMAFINFYGRRVLNGEWAGTTH